MGTFLAVELKRGVKGAAAEDGGVGLFPAKRRGVVVEVNLFFQLIFLSDLKIGVEMGDEFLLLLWGLRAEDVVGVAITFEFGRLI